ncbi:MAG: IS256 family transposase [Candidatus Cloacimonetes bacterium]|nr:IS256 family transposase [Candidatus Cloacimonadota bacterium]MBS3768557.1 IS256 family transposase [Candidatus Cloacimonadota bacterium]
MAENKDIEELGKLLSRKEGLFTMNELLQHMMQAVIESEVTALIGAKPYERKEQRKNHRNGSRERELTTSLGNLKLKIPKLKKGSFFPSILDRYQRIDRAMIAVIKEAYINGVSTRSMKKLYKQFEINNLSKSTVSRLIQPIIKSVDKWRSRDLEEEYVYIWLDAVETKIRQDSCVQPLNILHAVGLRKDGKRESLGFYLNLRGSYYGWKSFLQSLKQRGLSYCGLWIRDQFDGLAKALGECFPGQLQQRCLVHWQRNLLDKLNKKDQARIIEVIVPMIKPKSKEGFYRGKEQLLSELEKLNKLDIVDWVEDTIVEITNFLNYPQKHWRKIKSNNMIERFNQEIRRREKNVRIFPSEKSVRILIGSILQQQTEEWITGRHYIKTELDEAVKLMKKLKNGKQNIKINKVA